MVWVIYHNTNSTTMNDLYLKFDPSSNMNLTNLLLMCNVMGKQKTDLDTGTAPLSRLLHDLQPVSVYLSCCPGWCWPFHSSPVIISLWAACVGGHWTLDTVTGSGLRSHQPIPSQQTKCQGGLSNHVFYGVFELWAKLRDFCHDICHSVIKCSKHDRGSWMYHTCLISRRIFPHKLSPVWFSPGVTLAQSLARSSYLGPRPGPDWIWLINYMFTVYTERQARLTEERLSVKTSNNI